VAVRGDSPASAIEQSSPYLTVEQPTARAG